MSQPTLTELLDATAEKARRLTRKLLPGRVLSYDKDTNTCRVEVLLNDLEVDGDGAAVSVPPPVLEGVPVLQLRGRRFSLLFPLEKGDKVDLLFYDRSVERLLLTGEAGEPGDARRHDLNDVQAVPGFFTLDAVPPHTSASHASLGSESGSNPVRLYFKDDALCLGEESPAYSAALAEKVKSELTTLRNTVNALVTAFNSHTHLYAPGPSAPAPTAPPAASATAPPAVQDMGSSTVKVRE